MCSYWVTLYSTYKPVTVIVMCIVLPTEDRGHMTKLEGKYSLESTDPRESEIRAHLRR